MVPKQQHQGTDGNNDIDTMEEKVPLNDEYTTAEEKLMGSSDEEAEDDHEFASPTKKTKTMSHGNSNAIQSPLRSINVPGKPAEAGVITKVYCENFMCHRKLTVQLNRNVNLCVCIVIIDIYIYLCLILIMRFFILGYSFLLHTLYAAFMVRMDQVKVQFLLLCKFVSVLEQGGRIERVIFVNLFGKKRCPQVELL